MIISLPRLQPLLLTLDLLLLDIAVHEHTFSRAIELYLIFYCYVFADERFYFRMMIRFYFAMAIRIMASIARPPKQPVKMSTKALYCAYMHVFISQPPQFHRRRSRLPPIGAIKSHVPFISISQLLFPLHTLRTPKCYRLGILIILIDADFAPIIESLDYYALIET
jgi:hypothetical protein